MKVFIVTAGYDYEGAVNLMVFKDEFKARLWAVANLITTCDEESGRQYYDFWSIDEMEVQDYI